MSKYVYECYQHCIETFHTFEKSFEMQEWCIAQFGESSRDTWTLTISSIPDKQYWYFVRGEDAMWFKLTWPE